MTASSVESFPCRVQLMGLPPSPRPCATYLSARPPIARINGITRNLFGAPDPAEMQFIYEQETERNRSYVLQRYNFDTKSLYCTKEQNRKQQLTDEVYISQNQKTQLPKLIEQELRQYEQRLHEEKHRPNKTLSEVVLTKKVISNYGKCSSKISRRHNVSSSTLCPAIDCQKPYNRQSLLNETFNIRKYQICAEKHGQCFNPESTTLESTKISHRNPKIPELSQHSSLKQTSYDIYDIRNNFISKQHTEIKCNRSPAINCNDNCTTLSLQFIVSSQNAS